MHRSYPNTKLLTHKSELLTGVGSLLIKESIIYRIRNETESIEKYSRSSFRSYHRKLHLQRTTTMMIAKKNKKKDSLSLICVQVPGTRYLLITVLRYTYSASSAGKHISSAVVKVLLKCKRLRYSSLQDRSVLEYQTLFLAF